MLASGLFVSAAPFGSSWPEPDPDRMSCRQGIVGGYSARWSLKSFAQVGHTHLCNIVAMLGLSGWALAKNFNHVLGAMFLQEMLGNHNQVAMRTMLVTHGVKANMGKGEIVSCLAAVNVFSSDHRPLPYRLRALRSWQTRSRFLGRSPLRFSSRGSARERLSSWRLLPWAQRSCSSSQ